MGAECAYEYIVPPRALAVHRDGDFSFLQHRREVHRGELRALVGIEYVGFAISGERFLDRFYTESSFHRDRQPPGQNPATETIHDGAEIDKAACHRDVAHVHRPYVDGSDLQVFFKIF